jgi:hypothetical protein
MGGFDKISLLTNRLEATDTMDINQYFIIHNAAILNLGLIGLKRAQIYLTQASRRLAFKASYLTI